MNIFVLVGLSLVSALSLTGCATPPAQILDSMEPMAINDALQRGRFELACQDVQASLLSRELTQPAIQGPWVAGIQRGSFTIGISGCGQRKTYQILCPEGGDGCFSADTLSNIR
jgi:hypothetical protein